MEKAYIIHSTMTDVKFYIIGDDADKIRTATKIFFGCINVCCFDDFFEYITENKIKFIDDENDGARLDGNAITTDDGETVTVEIIGKFTSRF